MFVRKKKNKSGVVSIQVIDKSSGRYKVIKTIGSSSDPKLIDLLFKQGKEWIDARQGQMDMFKMAKKEDEEKQVIEQLISNIENILLNGTQLILDKIYRSIGFDKINDNILKSLVIPG